MLPCIVNRLYSPFNECMNTSVYYTFYVYMSRLYDDIDVLYFVCSTTTVSTIIMIMKSKSLESTPMLRGQCTFGNEYPAEFESYQGFILFSLLTSISLPV